MNSFRDFVIVEGLNVTTSPELESHLKQAKEALGIYLQRYGDNQELKASAFRFKYTLIKCRVDKWSNETTFYFKYDTIDKNRGLEADGKKTYKTPKDAIESIPENPILAYRGMSWEEWKNIQKTGVIQSAGQHNFNNENGLTFYGLTPDTGESYAGSFAPAAYKPTPTRPGIIIAIPRHLLKNRQQNPNIPQGELAHEGPLDAKNIANAWMLVATKIKPGSFDLTVNDRTKKVTEGSRGTISIQYAIRQLK